jgi:hypothetical protein
VGTKKKFSPMNLTGLTGAARAGNQSTSASVLWKAKAKVSPLAKGRENRNGCGFCKLFRGSRPFHLHLFSGWK